MACRVRNCLNDSNCVPKKGVTPSSSMPTLFSRISISTLKVPTRLEPSTLLVKISRYALTREVMILPNSLTEIDVFHLKASKRIAKASICASVFIVDRLGITRGRRCIQRISILNPVVSLKPDEKLACRLWWKYEIGESEEVMVGDSWVRRSVPIA